MSERNRPDPEASARRVLAIEAQAIRDLLDRVDEGFTRATQLLVNCHGRVIVTGMGKSGIIAQKVAATLSSTGSPAYFLHPAEALHGDLGMIVAGDLLLAISNSGETPEIVRLLELVRRLGVRIVGLSGDPESTLARHADAHLYAGVDQEACGLDLVPTASTTAALAMGDALAVATFELRGLTRRDLARFHPGGRLGRKLQLVNSLMHQGDHVPFVRDSDSVTDAIEEIDRKKLGMACVVDASGRLVGVITDGDLRRRMLRVGEPMRGTAADAMTRNPFTIAAESVAAEALKAMEDRKITSLPVVDASGRLAGVIQIHDLWRTELF